MTNKKEVKAGEIVGEYENTGVIYVVHPVTKERKKELMRTGKKIIDAKFKPAK